MLATMQGSQSEALLEQINPRKLETPFYFCNLEILESVSLDTSISRYQCKYLYSAGILAVKIFKEKWMVSFLCPVVKNISRPRKKEHRSFFPYSTPVYDVHHLFSFSVRST